MAHKQPVQTSSTKNFLRQFRDIDTRDLKQITASQFMEVWNHYDKDGNGYIEGTELDSFLYELVTSVNVNDVGPEVVSQAALDDAKHLMMTAFDENGDGKIDITELAQFLPMEENFLLLFRRDHPLESSVEFMKVWRDYDTDQSGYIEADELKNFLYDLLKQSDKEKEVSEEQLITYADTMLQMFDRNRDGKLQLSEMARTYRYIAYRRFTRWIWHRLRKYQRKVLPACVVSAIRNAFPSEEYTGFKYARP